jgi:hypothetical protein
MKDESNKGKTFQIRNAPWTLVSVAALMVFFVFWAQLSFS